MRILPPSPISRKTQSRKAKEGGQAAELPHPRMSAVEGALPSRPVLLVDDTVD
jgi:hypothetical protein